MYKKKAAGGSPDANAKDATNQTGGKKTPRKDISDPRSLSKSLSGIKAEPVAMKLATSETKNRNTSQKSFKPATRLDTSSKPEPREHLRPINAFRIPVKNIMNNKPVKKQTASSIGDSSSRSMTKKSANFIEENIRQVGAMRARYNKANKTDRSNESQGNQSKISKEMALSSSLNTTEKFEKENKNVSKSVSSLKKEKNYACIVEKPSAENLCIREKSDSRILKEKSMSDVNSLQSSHQLNKRTFPLSSYDTEEYNEATLEKMSSSSSETVLGRWIKPRSVNNDVPVESNEITRSHTSSEYVLGCSYAECSDNSSKSFQKVEGSLTGKDSLEINSFENKDRTNNDLTINYYLSDDNSNYPACMEPETEDAGTMFGRNKPDDDQKSSSHSKMSDDKRSRSNGSRQSLTFTKTSCEILPYLNSSEIEGGFKYSDEIPMTDHLDSIYDDTTGAELSTPPEPMDSSLTSTPSRQIENLNNLPLHIRVNNSMDPPSINVLNKTHVPSLSTSADADETYMLAPASSSHFYTEEENLPESINVAVQPRLDPIPDDESDSRQEDVNVYDFDEDEGQDDEDGNVYDDGAGDVYDDEAGDVYDDEAGEVYDDGAGEGYEDGDDYEEENYDETKYVCAECAALNESSPYCACASRPECMPTGMGDEGGNAYVMTVLYEGQNAMDQKRKGMNTTMKDPDSKEWAIRFKSEGATWQQQGDWASTARLLQELSHDLEDCQNQTERAERQVLRLKRSVNTDAKWRHRSSRQFPEVENYSSGDDYYSVTSSSDESDYPDSCYFESYKVSKRVGGSPAAIKKVSL